MSRRLLSYRAKVIQCLESKEQWFRAVDVADETKLTYEQTIYALNALLNIHKVARQGSKRGARWASVQFAAPKQTTPHQLHSIFHAFCRGQA